MKFLNIAIAFLLLTNSVAKAQKNTTKMDSASYAVGMLIAGSIKQQGITELNTKELEKGIADAMAGTPKMDIQKAQTIFQSYSKEQADKKFAGAKEAGAKFLEENKKKVTIQTTASGLQYEIIKQGTGAKPVAADKVLTHYHGTLIDGKVFDSSVQRGEPIEFGVGEVIKGWTEALQLMPCGSKYRLYVPYNLAYGEQAAGPEIGPFSTLIFDVELIKINGKDESGK
jgi:FKBP-type peptidyl-prolyl cis-trans isomerase FklB